MNKVIAFCLFAFLIVPNLGKTAIGHTQISKPNCSTKILSVEYINSPVKRDKEVKTSGKLKLNGKILWKMLKPKFKNQDIRKRKQSNDLRKTDGLAIAGFSIGLIGIPLTLLFLGFWGIIPGIVGLALSTIAFNRIEREPNLRKGKLFARAGQILGSLLTAGILIYYLLRPFIY